jgi:hypothetical protein
MSAMSLFLSEFACSKIEQLLEINRPCLCLVVDRPLGEQRQ